MAGLLEIYDIKNKIILIFLKKNNIILKSLSLVIILF